MVAIASENCSLRRCPLTVRYKSETWFETRLGSSLCNTANKPRTKRAVSDLSVRIEKIVPIHPDFNTAFEPIHLVFEAERFLH